MKAQIIETESIHDAMGGLCGQRIWIVRHPALPNGSQSYKSKRQARAVKAELDAKNNACN